MIYIQTWGSAVVREILHLGMNESTILFFFISAKRASAIPPGLYYTVEPLIIDNHSYSMLYLWREEDDGEEDEDKINMLFSTLEESG